ncbi:uncharacterized protein [Spinacia oleracea]|uniref:DUF4283 domain-containing protein n=1 Tax=Spinacia oleracea TaxID=3562 RepID=A0ABM3RS59_SPIOL|nr:uncharacterized protein LOC110788453 [Spinacia oleracea]
MARKTGAKNQGSKHGNGTSKQRGPSSDSQALRTRSMDELLTVEALDFGIENEVFTPKSGLHHLQTPPVEVDFDDIQEEVDYWSSAVVCYVVGQNPPINVMEGFIRRVWRNLNIDKVVSKPLVVKAWDVYLDMEKEDVKSIPIWCRKGKSKWVWVRKTAPVIERSVVVVNEPVVDPDGFQRALRPIRVRSTPVQPTQINNGFQVLETDVRMRWKTLWVVLMGLNLSHKQEEVKRFIQKYEVGLVGLLEHKVKLPNLGKLCQKVFQNWCFTSNASYHNGGRIVVAWKSGSFNVNITAASSQFIHCHITQEKIGMPVRQADIVDISNCMHVCSIEDIKSAWQSDYPNAEVCFLLEGKFAHSPGLLTVYPRSDGGRKPFKYFTMWKSSPLFLDTIQMAWNFHCSGSKMFVLATKLKRVKSSLKELNRVGFTDIQEADLKAYHGMVSAQEAMHHSPHDKELTDLELQAIQEYKITHKAYLDFLKQKVKVEWIKVGDENTSFFHQSIKSRRLQNQVYNIFDKDGVWRDKPDEVSDAFLTHYKELLGSVQDNRTQVIKQIVQAGLIFQNHQKTILNAPYTADEVKSALFSIPGVKTPGPDGFGS